MPGLFFSLDGLDGAGKSTQLQLFQQWLAGLGHEVVACRDPGSTPLGEAIRDLLLDPRNEGMSRRAEMLLYMAARAQLVDEVIRPALTAGKTVVSDRYLLANVVYQGHAGGLDVPTLWQIGALATEGLLPTLTIVLDISPQAAAERMNRPLDRMELESDGFRRRLRQGFLEEAARSDGRIAIVDASRPIEVVQAEIRSAAQGVLSSTRKG